MENKQLILKLKERILEIKEHEDKFGPYSEESNYTCGLIDGLEEVLEFCEEEEENVLEKTEVEMIFIAEISGSRANIFGAVGTLVLDNKKYENCLLLANMTTDKVIVKKSVTIHVPYLGYLKVENGVLEIGTRKTNVDFGLRFLTSQY